MKSGTKSSKSKNIPQLRFPEFSGEWEEKKLREIGEVLMCKRIFKDETLTIGDIPFYKIGTFGKLPDAYLTRQKYEEYKQKYPFPKKGDILLSASGTIGRQVVYDGKPAYFQDSNIVWLNHNGKRIINNFLEYLYTNIKWITDGNTINRLYNNSLLSTKIVFPSISEQQKIATFLSTVDNWIENLKAQNQALEQYKKGMMQKIFSQVIRFKDDDGKEFPEWQIIKLSAIFSKKNKRNNNNQKLPVLTNSATKGILNQHDFFDKDIANKNNLKNYYVVDLNDFVYNPRISTNAPVGPLKSNNYGKGIMSPLYTVLAINNGTPTFYEKYFETTLWHEYMYRIANYGARHDRMSFANLDFLDMPIPFPSLDEQQKIADYLSALDDMIESKQQQISQAELWKKGLLQKMFV